MEKTYNYVSLAINNFINTIVSILKVIVKSKFGIKLPEAKTESCILLGNGPSLAASLKDNSDFFYRHDLICVNGFSISKEYTELKPKYYVMLDPGFWKESADSTNDTIRSIKEKTTWPMFLLLPSDASITSNLAQIAQNKNIKITYYNYTVFKGFEKIAFWFYKHNLGMPQSQNVLVASIFLSINMGYKKVYLFGADHTWHQNLHVNEQNQLCVKDVHFYNDKEQVIYTPFYKKLSTKETFTVSEIFTAWAKVYKGYFILNKYAKHSDCCIYNASPISFIDAFERIKL